MTRRPAKPARKPAQAAKPAKAPKRRGRPPKAAMPSQAPATTPNGSGLAEQLTTSDVLSLQLATIQTRVRNGERLPNHESRLLRDAWLLDMATHIWPSSESAAADLGVSPNTFRGYASPRADGTPGCPGIEPHSPIAKAPILAWLLKHAHHQGGTAPATQQSIEEVDLSIKRAKDAKLWGSLVAEAEDRATQGVIETVHALRHHLQQTLPAQLAEQLRAAVDLVAAEDTARELIETALRDVRYQPPAAIAQTQETA